MSDTYKEAYDAAQQEHQNKEKELVKGLVLKYLENIDAKQKEKNKIEDEIQFYRKQLDYLKEGRLDKIEDMEKTVPNYKTLSPITFNTGTSPTTWSISYGSQSINGQTIKQWFGGAYKVGDKIIYF